MQLKQEFNADSYIIHSLAFEAYDEKTVHKLGMHPGLDTSPSQCTTHTLIHTRGNLESINCLHAYFWELVGKRRIQNPHKHSESI